MRSGRARARGLVLALGALLVAECASWVALRLLESRRELRYQTYERLIDPWRDKIAALIDGAGARYQRIDARLGWVTIPGTVKRFSAINQAGVRAAREYDPLPPPGVVRIAAFGDSYVHGDEVTTEQAWPSRLEKLQPGLEVLNYGVGGYGLDQTSLRLEDEGARFAPHVVLIGVIADDVLRGVNVFRPFFSPTTGHVLAKPRYVLDDGALRLLPNPLPDEDAYRAFLADPVPALRKIVPTDHYAPPASEAGPLDALASVRLVKLLGAVLRRPDAGPRAVRHAVFDLESQPVRLALATLHAMVARVRAQGAEPLVVFFPDITELDARRDGRPITYRPLLERLAADGVPVVDVLEGFDRRAPGWTTKRILRRSHYSPWGNQLAAEVVHDALVSRGLLPATPPR